MPFRQSQFGGSILPGTQQYVNQQGASMAAGFQPSSHWWQTGSVGHQSPLGTASSWQSGQWGQSTPVLPAQSAVLGTRGIHGGFQPGGYQAGGITPGAAGGHGILQGSPLHGSPRHQPGGTTYQPGILQSSVHQPGILQSPVHRTGMHQPGLHQPGTVQSQWGTGLGPVGQTLQQSAGHQPTWGATASPAAGTVAPGQQWGAGIGQGGYGSHSSIYQSPWSSAGTGPGIHQSQMGAGPGQTGFGHQQGIHSSPWGMHQPRGAMGTTGTAGQWGQTQSHQTPGYPGAPGITQSVLPGTQQYVR